MPRDKRNLVGAIEYFFIGAGGKGRGGRVLEHDGRGFDSGGDRPDSVERWKRDRPAAKIRLFAAEKWP